MEHTSDEGKIQEEWMWLIRKVSSFQKLCNSLNQWMQLIQLYKICDKSGKTVYILIMKK